MKLPKFFPEVPEQKQRAVLDDAARLWQISGRPLCPLTASVRFRLNPRSCMQIISYFVTSLRIKEPYVPMTHLVYDLRSASLRGYVKRLFKETDYWALLPLLADGYEPLLYFLQVFHGMRYMTIQVYQDVPFSVADSIIFVAGKAKYQKFIERLEQSKIVSFYVNDIAGFSYAALGYHYGI